MTPDDPWSRVDYRRLIAWPERIKREWPFLERALAPARGGLVLDLGCGTGEHSRRLAAADFEVIGIDASASMLAKAREEPRPPNLRFVEADLPEIGRVMDHPAAGAICLGNTMPHLADDAMRRFARALAAALRPGAPFVFQVLNYERILAQRVRHLPLNFRTDDEGGEVIFLRLMDPRPEEGAVVFSPTTLRYRPEADPPVEVTTTRSVTLRAWTWPELKTVFEEAGFGAPDAFGGYDGAPYDPSTSPDLLAVLYRVDRPANAHA
jgi:SAM-dependent methyltransferase